MPPLPRQAATTALLPLPPPNCCHCQHTAATRHRCRASAAAAANNLPPRLQPSCRHYCSAAKLLPLPSRCHAANTAANAALLLPRCLQAAAATATTTPSGHRCAAAAAAAKLPPPSTCDELPESSQGAPR